MNIGVDIKALAKGKAGIARYLHAILKELARLDIDNNYYLFEKEPSAHVPHSPRFKRIKDSIFRCSSNWKKARKSRSRKSLTKNRPSPITKWQY